MAEIRDRGSVLATENGIQILQTAKAAKRNHKGKPWTYTDIEIESGINVKTIGRFLRREKPIDESNARSICEALGVDFNEVVEARLSTDNYCKQKPNIAASKSTSVAFSVYNHETFAGRYAEIAQFTTLLNGSCRILAITGMTGIGKTALAERVVANLMEIPNAPTLPYIRFSLDDRSLRPDFSISGAALLRTLRKEPTLADQQDAANLLAHILEHLCSNPCRLQIDSLERLLKGNEQEGWSEFYDPLWLDLLHQFIERNDCPSQLLLTSQDITGDLEAKASRYPEFYRCETLGGLKPDEQQDLFQRLGLLVDPDSMVTDLDYLNRIGAFYDGHPLVLRVIADEILQLSFQGNVARYWHHYEAEFSETADPGTNKLARSRLFRSRVLERVKETIQRLPSPSHQMLCACAVFRRPVPKGFWLAMLTDEKPQAEFDMLQARHLVESVFAPDLVRQHNLIRSVAYDLLKADTVIWEQAERQAAELWLTLYKPAPDAPKLGIVRGYLEAFEHYYRIQDWESVEQLLVAPMKIHDSKPISKISLCWQLHLWGYYQEEIILCKKILEGCNFNKNIGNLKAAILGYLGLASKDTGDFNRAINYHKERYRIAKNTNDIKEQANALGDLGMVYDELGKFNRAIKYHTYHLEISERMNYKEKDYLECKSNAMGNLGNTYLKLKEYSQALEKLKKSIKIRKEIGNDRGVSYDLGNLGKTYYELGRYDEALNFHEQALAIRKESGVNDRRGQGDSFSGIGKTQFKLGNYLEASINNQRALEIFREIRDRASEAEVLKNLAELHQSLSEVEIARQYCHEALALATNLKIPLAAECQTLMESLSGS